MSGIFPYEQALAAILEAVKPTPVASIGVRQALGRVLAADMQVPRAMPDLPRSAVDGFAVQADQGPRFTVVQEVRAGVLPTGPLAPGEAAAIMTGAVVPEGADCVVMLEDCQLEGETVTTADELVKGALINPIGDEASAGQVFALAGTLINAAVHPALICAGLPEVPVHQPPRVALLISGDEVREIEDGPAPGQVFNTNQYILEAVCAGLGASVVEIHTVGDNEAATRELLAGLDDKCDLIITSGGVSKGRYDHLGNILRGTGFELVVAGTAIKPGRPLHVARSNNGTLVFGMPGYPSALLTNAFLYLVPALKKAAGRSDHATRWFPVQLSDAMNCRPGKTYLNRARFESQAGQWLAYDPGSQMSSHFLNFARCHGLVRMPAEAPAGHQGGPVTVEPGTVVQALDFGWELS